MQQYEIDALRERLRFDTPFWSGGVKKDSTGAWRLPRPGEFHGVAKIVDKSARLVPLIGKPWQLEFDEALEAQRAAGQPMRALVLKARQLGFSTWTEAKITQRVTQLAHQRALIVAHDVKTAGAIFDMAEQMHAHLPNEQELGLGFNIKPDRTGGSFSPNGRKFLSFGEKSRRMREQGRATDSILDIDTANSPEGGRGQTRHLVHLSEVARWPDNATDGTKSKMIAVLNSVPYLPETLVVLESTANGLNHFHKRWVAARDGQNDPDMGETYITIFVPWWREPAYAMPFATDDSRERFIESIGDTKRLGDIAEDEPMLQDVLGCTPEQLMWRRMQIRTQHEGKVWLFKQENPATDDEAFIGSGNPVFSGILVARAIKAAEAEPAPVLGTLRAGDWVTKKTSGGTIEIPQNILWVPEEQAGRDEPLLQVWEHPVTQASQLELPPYQRQTDGQYVISADVSEGASNTFGEGDFHAIHVIDHVTKMQVAEYESRMDLHKLPLWLVMVALYYNAGWLVPERNGPGIAVVEALKDYRYPRIYRQRRVGNRTDKVQEKIGWTTDQVTKPLIEDTFGNALQEETHGIRSRKTARQLNTYVSDDRGRHGALEGEHDDLLMAAMIARYVAVLLAPKIPRERRARSLIDDDVTGY